MLFLELDDANRDSRRHQFTPTFSIVKKSAYSEGQVYLSLKDLEFFLDDLGYQFTRIQDVGRYEKETIDHLHSEVLMPVVNLAPAIAAVNSKDRPQIASLRARGSFELKPVIGNRKGFILVLRNLVENSIKYAKGKTAHIEFKFEQDERDVTIDYYDEGIGIEDNEIEQVFVEGFRSLAARRTSNRGVGVGLSSSKEVMRALDGDLTCLRHAGGAHFRLRMRKAR
jgi:signal transduction histidine kinase